jgi:unsaturated chondroitin disaccharide hydrolase
MIRIDDSTRPERLQSAIESLWPLAARKLRSIDECFEDRDDAPVFTVDGRYTSRGWTEWTQGFQFGSLLLQFDATDDEEFLHKGRVRTLEKMAAHLTHFGVHDHGFNNVSTYGNLRRLALESRFSASSWEREFYGLALKVSAAVQARRWTSLPDGGGFIYSFNGPHSLFADTIRSLRSLSLGHLLGHRMLEENDRAVSLLERLVQHALSTARYIVFYGQGHDIYDVSGRISHEAIFNLNDGSYRCPGTQQGYSPFSTWTRGLAWVICGFAEQLEFLESLPSSSFDRLGGRAKIESAFRRACIATAQHYVECCPSDGIPYWDTGAPGLRFLEGWADRPADPFNPHEPVDSSAAAIAAQGLLRLAAHLVRNGEAQLAERFEQAGLTVAARLLQEPYLSADPDHQGLLLHSVYHRPRGWDHVPDDRSIPCGEASMWGDYHLMELAVYLQRLIRNDAYLTFWGGSQTDV